MNGNDLLEHEEENFDRIYEEFVKEHAEEYKNFSEENIHDENLEQSFIEYIGMDIWARFVEEDYRDYFAEQIDRMIDEEKDRRMGL